MAEDIVQDVFEKAYVTRDRFDRNRPFWPWLASIAARACIDVHRKKQYADSRLAMAAAGTTVFDDTTLATVVQKATEETITRAIAQLPVRQRLALELFALEGWTYEQIAAQLGHSTATVKGLIVRGRDKVRALGPQVLGGVVLSGRSLRARLHRGGERLQAAVCAALGRTGGLIPNLAGAEGTIAATCLTAAMVVAVLAGGLPVHPVADPSTGAGTAAGTSAVASASASKPATAAAGAPFGAVEPAASRPWRPSSDEPGLRTAVGATERSGNSAAASLLPPADSPYDRPDGVHPSSMAVSPGYERDNDPTIFMAGESWVADLSPPLLVSRDGGASWQNRRAAGLGGASPRLLLSPAYPRDNRVFATSHRGLHVSLDDADTFETLAAVPDITDAAISPAFDRGHPAILLVANGRLLQYRNDTGLLEPLPLPGLLAAHQVSSARYGHHYPDDPTILVGTSLAGAEPNLNMSRCRMRPSLDTGAVPGPRLECDVVNLPKPPSYELRLSLPAAADPNLVFVPNGVGLFVSDDAARTFRSVDLRFGRAGYQSILKDIDALPGADGRSAVVAHQGTWYEKTPTEFEAPLLRTDDAGRTWHPMPVDLPGFYGARKVVVTPTGRIIAAGSGGGIACSVDGETWARLCPTPDRVG